MYNIPELDQRLVIINRSGIDDVIILDENYKHLINESPNSDEREQFIVLHSYARRRIDELMESYEH